MSSPYEIEPIQLSFADRSAFTEVYGFTGSQGLVFLEGTLFRPERPSRTVILMMHPSSTLHNLPIPQALAAAGHHVMCCGSRYLKNDTALIMEKVALDLGAYVDHARNVLGYDKVVLLGWSGGGSLSLFYQAQAEAPTVTEAPAGDAVDLTKAGLIAADGVVFIAAHVSRAVFLTECLDASVLDEGDPSHRDPALDIYNADNPNRPPFTPKFIARYRAAQIARNRKITGWVKQTLADLKSNDDGEVERGFVVHRTMADPRWIDQSLESSDRPANTCYLGEPRVVNNTPAAPARFSTLRSWLSQWSYDDCQADGVASVARISVPLLAVTNGADEACAPSHAKQIFEAATMADKEQAIIRGASHYMKDQPEKLAEAVSLVGGWLEARSLNA